MHVIVPALFLWAESIRTEPTATGTPVMGRILLIIVLAVAAHLIVLGLRWLGTWLVKPKGESVVSLMRRHPKFVTLTTVIVSGATFSIYFAALGMILSELGVSLTAYFASASVIGLAVGFGSQGLVQDLVSGLTLIFSDVLEVGEVVDIGGQTGRVDRVGFRFTELVNVLNQRVYVPNRSITQIARYRRGHVRAYADVQLPEGADVEDVRGVAKSIAIAMRAQFSGLILADPEVSQQRDAGDGWQYIRITFRIWPGQGALIEQTFRRRVTAALKKRHESFEDWMVTITYRAVGDPVR